MKLKILVIGSGGREHALVWKIAQSPKVSKIYCAPGNAGISKLAQCIDIDADCIEKLVDFAQEEKIDLTVVGPELALSKGIVNEFNRKGLHIFGPSKKATEIESSKVFSKHLMKKYNIPTANYEVFQNSEKAFDYIKQQAFPLVIKADGLAAGKGVFIVKNLVQVRDALDVLMEEKKFGEAGRQVVIEEFLEGEEVTILAFCDGKTVVPMVSSQDHKKIFDNDQGHNTGGMGAYSPVPFYNNKSEKIVLQKILIPVIEGLQKEGREYKGVLYAGLVLTKEGPKVLEFNARFGDPETQVILPRLKTDLIDILNAVIEETLHKINIEWEDNAAICVVLASGGYPGKYQKGKVISGLERLKKMEDIIVFHAGSKLQDNKVITSGGRVLGITAWDETISKAKERAYKGVKEIYFEDMYYRKDIASKAIKFIIKQGLQGRRKNRMTKIKRALISVSDKEGIVDFARGLEELGIEIISTGGTARLLQKENIKVTLISEVTGFPEILEGRVKTLHPFIFGGILAKRESALHQKQIAEQEIEQIDLVVVNLYPFEKTVSRKEVELDDAIENIDIGGPSLLRAAAKNYQDVTVVINPQDYLALLSELRENDGKISLDTKKRLAVEVFEHTSFYDAIITKYLRRNMLKETVSFPSNLNLIGEKKLDLRYGENPHQKASFYKEFFINEANLGEALQLGGKELSFNNLIDLDAVLEVIKDFSEPTVVFVKHTNPCGLASAETIQEAYRKAYEGDPLSAYGSIIGINRIVDEPLANLINETVFVEAILAPDFQEKSLKILKQKKNRRIIKVGNLTKRDTSVKNIKKISGGILIQDRNLKNLKIEDLKVVTDRKLNRPELEELLFAWKVVKHTKSNAIVLTKDKQVVGVGAGQMSRVDSVIIAIRKSESRSKSSYLASDAFFPFRDGVDEAAKAGITAIIQPGGSKRDEEVIEAANEHNLAMVFTGVRCFKH